jgi:hypothetical protein
MSRLVELHKLFIFCLFNLEKTAYRNIMSRLVKLHKLFYFRPFDFKSAGVGAATFRFVYSKIPLNVAYVAGGVGHLNDINDDDDLKPKNDDLKHEIFNRAVFNNTKKSVLLFIGTFRKSVFGSDPQYDIETSFSLIIIMIIKYFSIQISPASERLVSA